MTRDQAYRYEMFVRVREFGKMHGDRFPPLSTGGRAFARVAEAMATIDRHQKAHIIATAAKRIKKTTRASVFREGRYWDNPLMAILRSEYTPDPQWGLAAPAGT